MGVEYTTFRHWCVCVYACVFNFKQIIEWHKFRMKNKIQMWESICVECIRCFWRNHLSINNNYHLRMSHIHKKTDKLIFSLFVCLFVYFPMTVAASSLAPFICPSVIITPCVSFLRGPKALRNNINVAVTMTVAKYDKLNRPKNDSKLSFDDTQQWTKTIFEPYLSCIQLVIDLYNSASSSNDASQWSVITSHFHAPVHPVYW